MRIRGEVWIKCLELIGGGGRLMRDVRRLWECTHTLQVGSSGSRKVRVEAIAGISFLGPRYESRRSMS